MRSARTAAPLNLPQAKFCSECATPLGAARSCSGNCTRRRQTSSSRPRSAAQAAVAERRLVSVLFADLVGFTSFSDGRDAEEVRDLQSRYFETVSEIIARYGGTVEKFIGDAVMALWGAPVAHEDDAERAVRAALDLVDSVRGLAPGIEARAGVLTGEAAVTIGATNQGMVAGDMVNTASRLQSVAAPSTVLVGEGTVSAAGRCDRVRARRRPGAEGQGVARAGVEGGTHRGAARRHRPVGDARGTVRRP